MSFDKNKIKGFVFDIGATLVEGPPLAPGKVITSVIPNISYRDVNQLIMTCDFGNPNHISDKLEELFKIDVSQLVREEINKLWDSQLNGCYELDRSGDFLAYIKSKGYKIALLSDIWHPYYEGVKKAIPDLDNLVDIRVLSFKTGHKKPAHYNFNAVTEELGLSPQELVMVGDTYTHDIEPAIDLGFNTAWLLRRPENGRELDSIIDVLNKKKENPTITIKSLWELKKIFNRRDFA